ncbi:related to nadh-ubiquinone oxidoreductase subunit b17.2 [Moesziomyces antarcticus]|uniref:Related to nadh-ubiquinone oxidoreductase subunit b17.2 n=1 Tax=Pseudozyma antarctica TaxID=84753 RepID=A0A5C3FXQ9_PSEA2|nr:related to nadh-ubiquinone oxidoreductase subunit b17.2 [Moesziomyces antarcticus]
MSLARTINYIRKEGIKKNGNKFYENHDEFPLRHRWVDYAADNEFNASQVDPLALPPRENITGTRGGFKTYNTTKPKISAWEPKVAERG